MDDSDAQLLAAIQSAVPLVTQPWRQLAEELGFREEDVRHRVRSLRSAGVIRRIGGVFEAARLGYRQTLLAVAVGEPSLEKTAGVLAGHPGVSHCYQRSDEFNLWATLAVSPDSTLGLDKTVEILADRCGAKAYLHLPAKQRFKLAVRIGKVRSSKFEVRSTIDTPQNTISLSGEQQRAVRALQMDLPDDDQPFDTPAQKEGFASTEELLVHAADFLSAGVLRRYSAIVNPVAAGAKANVLVVWCVPDDMVHFAGTTASQHQTVSHCYLRETTSDWLFNLYTMIHAPSREDCVRDIESISAAIGNPRHRELWTIREFKKSPVLYFTNAETEREKQYASPMKRD